jgi:hypothetical protein
LSVGGPEKHAGAKGEAVISNGTTSGWAVCIVRVREAKWFDWICSTKF